MEILGYSLCGHQEQKNCGFSFPWNSLGYINAAGFKQEYEGPHGLSDNENVGLERRES